MNLFVIHSGTNRDAVHEKIGEMKRSCYKLNPLMLGNGGIFWKLDAARKIQKAQIVVFFVGAGSHTSDNIAWELKQAHKCGKPIYTILLAEGNPRHDALKYCDDFSKEVKYHDELKTMDEVLEIISAHEKGNYQVFNESNGEIDKQLLLEQYKAFLQTSEDLVLRRQNVNNFYISINSAIIAIFSALLAFDIPAQIQSLVGILFAILGVVLSVAWIKILVAYGNLNGSKMKIISSIEKQLPASLFDAEWAALSDKLNKKRYVSFTDNEKRVPMIFIVIYSAIILALLGALIVSRFS